MLAMHILHPQIHHDDRKRKRCQSWWTQQRSGCSRGRGLNYTGARTAAKSGLCAALGNNVFDYGHRAAADQMSTLWDKLVQFMGTNYG
jgi:hypothetical protein